MKTLMIMLKSIDDVKFFVNEVNKLSCDVDLATGRYVVDAKSIMGIFSLDLTKPIQVDIQSKNDTDCAAFVQNIAKFQV